MKVHMSGNSLAVKNKEYLNTRHIVFLFCIAAAFIMAYLPVKVLYSSDKSEYYSHIALIPLISVYLLYMKRREIFAHVNYFPITGIPVLLLGIALFWAGSLWGKQLDENNYASLIIFSIFIFTNGAFILLYGSEAYRNALFPLLFLIFAVPIPSVLMDRIIYVLQVGSTEFANLLFLASGTPFMRDGFIFHLPNVSIEIAKQCSGIRSGMAIFIVAVLAGNMFLKSYWKMIFLVICAVLIAMLKNSIRILTLTLLGNYVDPRILSSSLHREGGIPFFILALLLLAPILFLLRKSE
jgi:exosortase